MYEHEFDLLKQRIEQSGTQTSAQSLITKIGANYISPDEPSQKLNYSDALERLSNVEERLMSENYPVHLNIYENGGLVHVTFDLVNPDAQPPYYYGDYITLFGFNIAKPDSHWEPLELDLITLHRRVWGTQILLNEIFRGTRQ